MLLAQLLSILGKNHRNIPGVCEHGRIAAKSKRINKNCASGISLLTCARAGDATALPNRQLFSRHSHLHDGEVYNNQTTASISVPEMSHAEASMSSTEKDFKILQFLLDTGKYTDLRLECGEIELKVHRSIVCAQSEFFDAACHSGFKVCVNSIGPIQIRALKTYTTSFQRSSSRALS